MRRIALAARSAAAPKIPQARLLSTVSPAPVETVPEVVDPYANLDLHTFATEKILVGKTPYNLFYHEIDNLRENLEEHIHPIESQALEEIQNSATMSPDTARKLLAAVEAGEVSKGVAFSLFSIARSRVRETWLPVSHRILHIFL